MISNKINAYWAITKTGITGGTLSIKGQYKTTDVIGNERNLSGYYFDGTDWSSGGETHDTILHRISAPITSSSGVLLAMNQFIAVGSRAFLQGAYNSTTGLMSDSLRSGGNGINIIPLSDPYRSAPYNTSFFHVNNTATETAASTVFANKTAINDNIVDWVFLELRNTNSSPGNTILQTRSALIQRDGDIVDIDGVSPVTFNNFPLGNYVLSVRHRNHLGISLNPITGAKMFTEKSTLAFTTNVADFRTSALLFGTSSSYSSAFHPTLTSVRLLWGGNANMNSNVKYIGLQNDKDFIFIKTLNTNPTTILNNTYSPADLNMNKIVRYSGINNDKDFLFSTVLGSSSIAQRIQTLP